MCAMLSLASALTTRAMVITPTVCSGTLSSRCALQHVVDQSRTLQLARYSYITLAVLAVLCCDWKRAGAATQHIMTAALLASGCVTHHWAVEAAVALMAHELSCVV
jgi:hypothetical protein